MSHALASSFRSEGVLVGCSCTFHGFTQLLGHCPGDQPPDHVTSDNAADSDIRLRQSCHATLPHHSDDRLRNFSSAELLTHPEKQVGGVGVIEERPEVFPLSSRKVPPLHLVSQI